MFVLSEEQKTRITQWHSGLVHKMVENGDERFRVDDAGNVDYGAIGGGLTYMVTPTSIGMIIKVQEALSGEILDVSDYENW